MGGCGQESLVTGRTESHCCITITGMQGCRRDVRSESEDMWVIQLVHACERAEEDTNCGSIQEKGKPDTEVGINQVGTVRAAVARHWKQ